jgi:hypothetical protein
MRQVLWTAAILLVAVFAHTAVAQDVKRTAIVVDKAGVLSEVTDLSFSAKLQQFDNSYGRIALFADPYDIAIPLDNLIAIEASADGYTVTYLWRGKECITTGKWFSGDFTGKSDFGDLKLHTSDLKSIKFDRPPTIKKEEEKDSNLATLTLVNGARVTVNNLKRHNSYYSTAGYLIGGKICYVHYTDLRFLRGESLVTVGFEKIKRIEFTGEKGVSVTLKNGKKATGDISTVEGGTIVGFTGVFDKGELFIAKKHLRTIEFASGKK